jgi:hypothetical protein
MRTAHDGTVSLARRTLFASIAIAVAAVVIGLFF